MRSKCLLGAVIIFSGLTGCVAGSGAGGSEELNSEGQTVGFIMGSVVDAGVGLGNVASSVQEYENGTIDRTELDDRIEDEIDHLRELEQVADENEEEASSPRSYELLTRFLEDVIKIHEGLLDCGDIEEALDDFSACPAADSAAEDAFGVDDDFEDEGSMGKAFNAAFEDLEEAVDSEFGI